MSQQATPFIGQDAEAIKARAAAFNELNELFGQYDISDPKSWIAIVQNGSASMLADLEQLPQVAYALCHLLVSCVKTADSSDNPAVAMHTRMALATVLQESFESSSQETDNENDQHRTAS